MAITTGQERILEVVKAARAALGGPTTSDENVLRLALWLEAGPEVCATALGTTVVNNR